MTSFHIQLAPVSNVLWRMAAKHMMAAASSLAVLVAYGGHASGAETAENLASAPTPACMLGTAHNAEVRWAAEFALATYQASGTSPKWKSVAVNERRHLSGDALRIEIIRDRAKVAKTCIGPVVSGGCEAIRTGLIRCSSGVIDTVLADDPKGNPALLFILAHEIGHLFQEGPPRAFSGAPPTVKGNLPLAAKIGVLQEVCERFQDDVTLERDADRRALQVLRRLLTDPSYGFANSRLAAADISGRVRLAGDRLDKWLTNAYGPTADKTLLDELDKAPLPSTELAAASLAHKALCHIAQAHEGIIAVPVFRGSHPDPAERLARLSAELLKANPRDPIDGSNPASGAVDTTISGGGAILGALDQEYSDLRDQFGSALCSGANRAGTEGLSCR